MNKHGNAKQIAIADIKMIQHLTGAGFSYVKTQKEGRF